jgi:mono/diheme cytochrome c family protein
MSKMTRAIVALLLISPPAWPAAPDGKMLFQQNCAVCHGDRAQGKIGPKLAGDSSKWPPRIFERAVLTGIDDEGKPLKAPMPHWNQSSFVSDQGKVPSKAEIDAIQRYIRTR